MLHLAGLAARRVVPVNSTLGHTSPLMALLFVYGSLKEGFPNFHVNRGRRLQGQFATAQPHPLVLVNGRLPCLLPLPGTGHNVIGQLFEVSPVELTAMDELERVGVPGGYARVELEVQNLGVPSQAPIKAFAYVQDPELLNQPGEHVGPLSEYTSEHAKRLRW